MIYEYRCKECEGVSEVWAKMSDPAPESCPKCGQKTELEKVISKSGFALKGTGWYTTDYKRASSSDTKKSEG